jgi:Ca-activated chloride channel family protein
MFRFEDPIFLYALALLPLLALIHIFTNYRRRKRLRVYGDPALLKQLMPDVSRYRNNLKFWLMLTALGLLIVVVARPQFGTKVDKTKRAGIEAIIAMDISNSMMAQDVAPSRLEKSKLMVSNLVDKMVNDKVGLIVFAGDAFTQLPITSDYVSAKMFLDNISPNLITTQGTDIKEALDMASKSFTQQENVGRAVIVITDGENHEPGAVESAKALAKQGVRVFVLGVGSPSGAPIPIPGSTQYRKDREGNTVVTKLDEQMCDEIAAAGKGVYIHVDNTESAQQLLSNELDKLAKKELDSTVYSEYDEQFQAVAILALVVLLIEMMILERKNPFVRKLKLFRR